MSPDDVALVHRMDADELRLLKKALSMHAPIRRRDLFLESFPAFLLGVLCVRDLLGHVGDWSTYLGLVITVAILWRLIERVKTNRETEKTLREAQAMIDRHRGLQ